MDGKKKIVTYLFAAVVSLVVLYVLLLLISYVVPQFGFYLKSNPIADFFSILELPKTVLSGISKIYEFHFLSSDIFWWVSFFAMCLSLISIYVVVSMFKLHKNSFALYSSASYFALSVVFTTILYWNSYNNQMIQGVNADLTILISELIQKLLLNAFASLMLFLWQLLIINFDYKLFVNSVKTGLFFSIGLVFIEIMTESVLYAYYGNQYVILSHSFDLLIGIFINSILWAVIFFNAAGRKIDRWAYAFVFFYLLPEILYFGGRSGNFLDPVSTAGTVIAKVVEMALLYFFIIQEKRKDKDK